MLKLIQKINENPKEQVIVDLSNDSEPSSHQYIPVNQSAHLRNAIFPPNAPIASVCYTQQQQHQYVHPDQQTTLDNKTTHHSAIVTNDNVLDYSPFTFCMGINIKRMLKAHSSLSKQALIASLACLFCN